jgi:SAM-dependent methyltransferase
VLGVVAFSAVSFLQLAPVWWFGIALAFLLWFVRREKAFLWVNVVAGLIVLINVAVAGGGFIWSPYHKITASPLVIVRSTGQLQFYSDSDTQTVQVLPREFGFHVAVDEDFLQMALNLSPAAVARYPFLRPYQEHYDLAYRIPGFAYHDVLIVGAGTGNDAAAALRHGAEHVDAVEIDPAIVELGRKWHPEHPYDDPRVTVWVDDARSFFHKTNHRYDMIVFGLLDSHRLFSSMSSVRLDSFVFTVESFREVRRLLKDDGIVVVEHGLGAPFMETRMYEMLTKAYGMAPAMSATKGTPGYAFITGPGLPKYLGIQQPQTIHPVEPATDDWPFLYLEGRTLPRQYGVALVTLLTISVASVFGCSGGRLRGVDLHFFFLGSAFLLIETLSVTRFALLFGSTWVVNSIVFTAILLVVLLANLWVRRLSAVNLPLCYALLGISVLVNFLYPIHHLLGVSLGMRLVVAMILMGSPVFFAAFVFAHSFKYSATPDLAFASNLLGAVMGGLAEYTALMMGFRHLLMVALGMYALSYAALLWKRNRPLLVRMPG